MARNILILGASYGSLLATKLLMAGHNVSLVCRARPPAGLGGRDRHHGGARHRRRRIRDRAGRAARADADRGAGLYARGRGAGDKVLRVWLKRGFH